MHYCLIIIIIVTLPPLAIGPLQCNLSLTGPNHRGILFVSHNCSREVTSLCQVSQLPPTPCTYMNMHTICCLGMVS